MRILQGLFRYRLPAPHQQLPAPHPDVLWSEISSAIGAAGIHIRAGDDVSIIVEVPGYGAIKYESAEARRFLKASFPDITDTQLTRALRYLNNRVVAKRRQDDDNFRKRHPELKNWSASEW